MEDSGTDEEIPLPNVKTAILSKAAGHGTCQLEVEMSEGGQRSSTLFLVFISALFFCRVCVCVFGSPSSLTEASSLLPAYLHSPVA